ncbi:MAG: prepilin-type N-terminal cleavage/methylation domain-containing protein [Patescibacteria group bacterium]|nr:prepilin-type N-terminal cleavage/methylation domain-containing protein [Patescibacteria group bacterium]
MLIKNKQKKEYGFTLIEVIVAIFILTVGIGGSFMLIQQTLAGVSTVQSRLIAIYLGQEGIEIIRNIRDNNWLEQRESLQIPPQPLWNDGLTGLINCQPSASCCEADYNTDTSPSDPLVVVAGCDFSDLHYLNFDNSGFYSYSAGTQTKFKRKIFIEEIDENKMKITVIVQWKEKNKLHEIKVIEHITNWYKQRIQ